MELIERVLGFKDENRRVKVRWWEVGKRRESEWGTTAVWTVDA